MDQENSNGERQGGSTLSKQKIALLRGIGAVLLTLVVRLYLFERYFTINNDGVLYIEAARHFWEGAWREGLGSFYPPLFPLLIALVYPLIGDWELAGQFWPFVLGVLVLLPLFALLRRIYGVRVAQVALFFYGVSPYLARLSLEVRTEVPYVFFVVLALYLLQKGLDTGSLTALFSMGISSALAYLIRPEGAGVIMVAVSFLLYQKWLLGRVKQSRFQLGVVVLGFILFSFPYVLYLRLDTGSWLVSRKAGMIMSMGLARYDPNTEFVGMDRSDQVGMVQLIRKQPLTYVKKVLADAFRSLGFYFEALHYSYLPFLLVGWYLLGRERFWEKKDFLLLVVVLFYLAAFSLLYVTRRYGIPLAALSLGWVGAGYLAADRYFRERWEQTGRFITWLLVLLFAVGTLPKTLQAIGRDKFYLREAGYYLRAQPGSPTILTTNQRVAFYAAGHNRVLLKSPEDISRLLGSGEGDYLALDQDSLGLMKTSLERQGWSVDRKYSEGKRESLFILRRAEG